MLEIVWWLIAGPVIAVEALLTALVIAPLSYGLSFTQEGSPVAEPIFTVYGPRYYSLKIDPPFTDRSLWYYVGDEVEGPASGYDPGIDVDENTWTFRVSDFDDTTNLRGDETGGDCRLRGY